MKVVYLASPYRTNSDWRKYQNIQNAHSSAKYIWDNGCVCINPIGNSAWMGGEIPEKVFLDGDIEILKRCDAIFMNFGWQNSKGCVMEWEYAKNNNIPVFYKLNELVGWAHGEESSNV